MAAFQGLFSERLVYGFTDEDYYGRIATTGDFYKAAHSTAL